jgi:nickel superoxide dismutase
MVEEHIKTIEKATKLIVELSGKKDKNFNQIVRWITNKENHAYQLQEIVYQYFMTQRVKPVDPANAEEYARYVHQITLLHKMLVSAMKTKQTTDLSHVEELRSLVAAFEDAYFGGPEKKQGH